MTSIPASRSARAMIFAPRSCPSSPGLATTTRILRVDWPPFSCSVLASKARRSVLPHSDLHVHLGWVNHAHDVVRAGLLEGVRVGAAHHDLRAEAVGLRVEVLVGLGDGVIGHPGPRPFDLGLALDRELVRL